MCINLWKFPVMYLIMYLVGLCNASSSSQSSNYYVNVGDDLMLPCTVDNFTTASWQGPCLSTTECIILNTSTTLYFDGLMRNPKLSPSITVKVNESERGSIYDLHMPNVAVKNTGPFKCSGFKKMETTETKFKVILKGTPEILPKSKKVQYGKYKKPVSLQIFVYSTTIITIERIVRNDVVIASSMRLAANESFKNEHKVTHDIAVLQKVDFAQYTFEVKNDQGKIKFTVSLEAKDIPETPDIKQLTVTDSSIMLQFSDKFDGGSSQVFVLQYRSTINWTSVEINDTFDGIGSYTLHNLEVGQKYYFRIYSVNTVGQSNVSEVWSIELPGAPNTKLFQYIFIATGIVVILVITTLISKKVKGIKTCLARRNNNEENDSVHEQQGENLDALVENQLYLAFDSLPRNPQQNASGTRPRHVAAQNHGENSMQSRNLHYAELEFNPASHRFFIRGDDRTIYSEIDHSLVAPPLESSDSEEDDKKNEDEDDFMSVEEVAELMRGKGMRPASDD